MRISSRLWRGRRRSSAHRHLQSRQARASCSGFRRFGGLCLGSASTRTGPMHTTDTALDRTADLHVTGFATLPTPAEVIEELPVGDELAGMVTRARDEVRAIMDGDDDRLLVVVGPCSIHDPEA